MFLAETLGDSCTYFHRSEVNTIHVPPGTRVGDMFVSVNTGGVTRQGFGLIVRRKGDTEWGVVGVANHLIDGGVVHYKLTSPDVDYGYIFWHPLELQVVAIVLAHLVAWGTNQQTLNKTLNDECLTHLKSTYFSMEETAIDIG
jgi:hypothetical protein